ncbi:hypothetical protein HGI30_16530 [Paenibacillus albicereus]|uniref:Beta-carotene 15,15'-monooxygenase n=1 Tax=Paenibacillus albicereus TaxID=2726185 RepID=A0A6H2H095_9BACL|nr:hypothetical protein [Paenibacillus albicereus]QJC53019.1 hypothetical protein HGI30_16530 [Paenibacillus albicereus]
MIFLWTLALARSELYERHAPILSTGMALDLMLVIPLLLLLAADPPRRWLQRKHLTTASLSVLAGYLACRLIFDPVQQQRIEWIGFILLPLELLLLAAQAGWLFSCLVQARRAARELRRTESALEAIQQETSRKLGHGPVGAFAAHELSVLYLAFLSGKDKPSMADQRESGLFSVHRHSGRLALTITLGSLLIAEGAALHVLLHSFSPLVAWAASASNLYLLLLLLADWKAMRLCPIQISDDELHLRCGLQLSCKLAPGDIRTVERVRFIEDDPAAKKSIFSPPGGNVNVLIRFARPMPASGWFGRPFNYELAYLHVDEPDSFIEACRPFLAPPDKTPTSF